MCFTNLRYEQFFYVLGMVVLIKKLFSWLSLKFLPLVRAPIVSGPSTKIFSILRIVKIPVLYKKPAENFEPTYWERIKCK